MKTPPGNRQLEEMHFLIKLFRLKLLSQASCLVALLGGHWPAHHRVAEAAPGLFPTTAIFTNTAKPKCTFTIL